jgi:diguanylate cyclase
MLPTLADLLYGFASAVTGSTVTWCLCRAPLGRKKAAGNRTEAQHTADVLVRLHELTTRVAVDVDDHNSQVQELNERLASAGGQEPAKIVDVVARLIEANQSMQKKLVSTEDKLHQQAEEMRTHVAEARTDALTLLANRRALDDELARRIAEFRRQGRIFALTMVDVDHFKRFNDTHGHQAGDEVLRDVAKLLRRKMRELDVVARYGGEEFAIIHPGTTAEDACRAATRAREAIANAELSHGGVVLRVTVSLGVAQIADHEEPAALIARADKALYASKAGGRNCVHWHDGKTARRFEVRKEPAAADRLPPREALPREAENGPPALPVQEAKAAEKKADPAWKAIPHSPAELLGRTFFCQQVRSRMSEWKRGGPTFSIALIEVDQYDKSGGGQQARETVTVAATRYLTETVREMDVLGNYSPGCFALLLPTAGLSDAIRVAERLREGFARSTAAGPGEPPRLTASVSVAQAGERDDPVSLLQRAEAALDAADRRGGNRAYYHDGTRCAPITAMLETMDYLS